MPSSITHLKIGKKIGKYIAKNYKIVKSKIFTKYHLIEKMSLGQDLTYDNANLFKTSHKYHTQDFFISLLYNIKKDKLYENNNVMSFLYGHIIHLTTDSILHPFIYFFDKGFKQQGLIKNHQIIEWEMDKLISKLSIFKNQEANLENIKANIYDQETTTLIDKLYDKVYQAKNTSKIYQSSEKKIYLLTKILTKINQTTLEKYLYYPFFKSNNIKNINFLFNSEHYTWTNPFTFETFNNSLEELINQIITKSITLIQEANLYIYGYHDSIDKLLVVFKDLSYNTNTYCDYYTNLPLQTIHENPQILKKYLCK